MIYYSGNQSTAQEEGRKTSNNICRPATTYVDQLRNDTGLSIAELKSIIFTLRVNHNTSNYVGIALLNHHFAGKKIRLKNVINSFNNFP